MGGGRPLYIVSHNDVDGVAASALAELALGKGRKAEGRKAEGRKVTHYFLDYPTALDVFSKIRGLGLKDSKVVFVDISVNSAAAGGNLTESIKETIAALNDANNETVLCDHHKWPEKDLEAFSELLDEFVVEEPEKRKCTTEMLYERLLSNDLHAKKLAGIAHASDFEDRTDLEAYKTAMRLQDVITYADILDGEGKSDSNKTEIAGKLARGILWDKEMDEFYQRYQPIKRRAFRELENNIRYCPVNGYKAAFAFVPEELANKAGLARLKEKAKTADLHIIVKPSGRVLMSLSEGMPDCLLGMVGPFGGRGRGRTGGGRYGRRIEDSNYREAVEDIAKKMGDSLDGCVRSSLPAKS